MGCAMSALDVGELALIECLPFQEELGGFALPLFAHPTDSELRLVQEVNEYHNTIERFRVLRDSLQSATAVSNGPRAAIGGSVLHVFLNEDGIPYAGTLRELTPILRTFIQRQPTA